MEEFVMPAKPLTMLLVMLAGWINRQQQDVIDYLKEENKILREKLGKRRIILNDDQRRRLAIKGKTLGRSFLEDICCVFSPDTILKWQCVRKTAVLAVISQHFSCKVKGLTPHTAQRGRISDW
jgi:hypothetical protein